MEVVVVEQCFQQPIDPGRVRKGLQDNAWCRKLHGVRHIESLIATDGLSMLCVFEAPDAEAVRIVARKMGYRFERAYGVVRVGHE